MSEQFKSLGLQAVAHQQRSCFVVFNVAGRPATAQDIVIHARQVVMHERVGMDQFHGAGDDFQSFRCAVRQLAGGKCEQGAHAFASAQAGVAHGLMQASGNGLFGRQQAR